MLESNWLDVDDGALFPTGVTYVGILYPFEFSAPVTARFFKITPTDWESWPIMRVGLLFDIED